MLNQRARQQILRRFQSLTAARRADALLGIPQEYHAYLTAVPERCPGSHGQPCVYALDGSGDPARLVGRRPWCAFCDDEGLRLMCSTASGLRGCARRLQQLAPAARQRALEARVPASKLDAVQVLLVDAVVPAPQQRGRKRPRAGSASVYTGAEIEAMRSTLDTAWAERLAHRQSGLAAPSAADCATYARQAVQDRARVHREMGQPVPAENADEPPDNDCGLPIAKRSRFATDLEL